MLKRSLCVLVVSLLTAASVGCASTGGPSPTTAAGAFPEMKTYEPKMVGITPSPTENTRRLVLERHNDERPLRARPSPMPEPR